MQRKSMKPTLREMDDSEMWGNKNPSDLRFIFHPCIIHDSRIKSTVNIEYYQIDIGC